MEVERSGNPVIQLVLLHGVEEASLPAGEPAHHKKVALKQTDAKVPGKPGQDRAQALTLELAAGFQQKFGAGL